MIEFPFTESGEGRGLRPYRYGANRLLISADIIVRVFDGLLAQAIPLPSASDCSKVRYVAFGANGVDILDETAPVADCVTLEEFATISGGLKRLKDIALRDDACMSEPLAARSFLLPHWPSEKEFYRRCHDPITGKEQLVILWGIFRPSSGGEVVGADPLINFDRLIQVLPPLLKSPALSPVLSTTTEDTPAAPVSSPAPERISRGASSSVFPWFRYLMVPLLILLLLLALVTYLRGCWSSPVASSPSAMSAAALAHKNTSEMGMRAQDLSAAGSSSADQGYSGSSGSVSVANLKTPSASFPDSSPSLHSAPPQSQAGDRPPAVVRPDKRGVVKGEGGASPSPGAPPVEPPRTQDGLSDDSLAAQPKHSPAALPQSQAGDRPPAVVRPDKRGVVKGEGGASPSPGAPPVEPPRTQDGLSDDSLAAQPRHSAGTPDNAAPQQSLGQSSSGLIYKWIKLDGPADVQSPWIGEQAPPLRGRTGRGLMKNKYRQIVTTVDGSAVLVQELLWIYEATDNSIKGDPSAL